MGETTLMRRSHGWRWVDRSGWSEEEEVENVRQAITGEQTVSVASDLAVSWFRVMVQAPLAVWGLGVALHGLRVTLHVHGAGVFLLVTSP
jgi:hypothetical protein